MRAIFEWVGSWFGGNARIIKVEGKETKEAKKRTKRLKAERVVKEERTLVGNKKSTDYLED
jgi:hypothetical protein